MNAETMLDVIANSVMALHTSPTKKKMLMDYINELLKEIRRLQECERKLAEVAAL